MPVPVTTAARPPRMSPTLLGWFGDLVRLRDVAQMFGVSLHTVKWWRGNAIDADRDSGARLVPLPNTLPPPVRLPDEIAALIDGEVWHRADLRRWGMQTGRLNRDGEPTRLSPPGRPRTRPIGGDADG